MRRLFAILSLLLMITAPRVQGQPAVKGMDPFAQMLPVIKEERLPYVDTSHKIRSIVQRSYRPAIISGQLQQGRQLEEIVYEYDTHGGLVKRTINDPVDNSQDSEVSILPHSFNSDTEVTATYTYDVKGNITEIPHLAGVYGASQKLAYNTHNQITELKQYFPGDTLQWIQTSRYNDKNQLSETDDKNARGQIVSKQFYRYDERGNKNEMFTVDENNRIPTHWKLSFDTAGKVTEMLVTGYEAHPKKQVYKYTYDALGRKDKIYIAANDSTRLYSVYQYDTAGPGYTQTEYNTAGTILTTVGNHTKKQQRFDARTHQPIVTREWKYDSRNNITWYLETRYPPAGQSQLPSVMSLETDEIRYR